MFMLGDVLREYIPPLRNPRLSHAALVAAGAVAAAVLAMSSGGQALQPVQAAPACGGEHGQWCAAAASTTTANAG